MANNDKKHEEIDSTKLGDFSLLEEWKKGWADIKAKQSAPIPSIEEYQKTDEFKKRLKHIHEGWAKRPPGRKFMGITFAGKKPKQ